MVEGDEDEGGSRPPAAADSSCGCGMIVIVIVIVKGRKGKGKGVLYRPRDLGTEKQLRP